jgi:hypothetical protein
LQRLGWAELLEVRLGQIILVRVVVYRSKFVWLLVKSTGSVPPLLSL